MRSTITTTKRIRFSLAFILFVALCVAGTLGGYRAGFDEGYASGKAKRDSEQLFPKIYRVGDLIRNVAAEEHQEDSIDNRDLFDLQYLTGAIEHCVFPGEWEQLGGPCSIHPIPALEALVVNATSGVHDRIETLITDLAAVRAGIADARVLAEETRAMMQAYRNRIHNLATERLGKPVELLASDFVFDGTWVVTDTKPPPDPLFQYTFIDSDTVAVTSLHDGDQIPTETWYFASPNHIVVSGDSYHTFTTAGGDLVLINSRDTETILVATKSPNRGEP